MDGQESDSAGLECGEGSEVLRMGDSGIVEAGEGFSVDDVGHLCLDVGTGADSFATEFLGPGEGLPENGCSLALVRGQVDVTAADGEAIRLADGGDAYDFEREFQVPGHATDDDELLGVLLAEIGAIGLDDVKELGDDGGDADEVAGSRGPFVEVGDGAGIDSCVRTGVVHLLGGGSEDEADTGLFEHTQVTVEISGVGGEVLVGAELGGVDKDGGGYGIILDCGAFDEGHVAAVEEAHSGDETEGAGGRGPGGSEVGDGVEDLHGMAACNLDSR